MYSELATVLLKHKGKTFSLEDYVPMKAIYDDQCKSIVLLAGRQISKSTTLCTRMVMRAKMRPHHQQLYSVPLREQANRFSRQYLDSTLRSMVLKVIFMHKDSFRNVTYKQLSNGSVINITYFGDHKPDRGRGIPSDENLFDEVQDLLWDDIIILNECLSGSPHKFKIYSGTPKTMENTLQMLFENSSQNEWAMPCSHCGKYNVPHALEETLKMLEPKGLSCQWCKGLINPVEGEWVSFRSELSNIKEGYHIPQIIIPRNVNNKESWADIIEKRNTYPPSEFANEVLGLSQELGGRLITRAEIEACCTGCSMYGKVETLGYRVLIGGVDWGVQDNSESFTVLTIIGVTPGGKMQVLFANRFLDGNVLNHTHQIIDIAKQWGVKVLGCDFGCGHTNNLLMLERNLGHIIEYQYVPRAKYMQRWHEQSGRYIIDRTTSMNILFMDIKRGRFIFPPVKEFTPFADEILSPYEDLPAGSLNKRFVRTPGKPDDFFHALNFATLTAKKYADLPLV